MINYDNFFDIYENVDVIPLDKNIHLSGYFQFDKHIIKNKEYIVSILNEKNI